MTSAALTAKCLARVLTMVLAAVALAVASTATAATYQRATYQRAIACRPDAQRPFGHLLPVVVTARRGQDAALRSRVQHSGGFVCSQFGGLMRAVIPRHAERDVAPDAKRISGVPQPYALGNDEGVGATNAAAWHSLRLTGTGAKIAIIDVGFGGLRAAEDAGRVPTSAVTVDMCPTTGFSGQRHGTAVAEVASDEAPAAQLYLICVDDRRARTRGGVRRQEPDLDREPLRRLVRHGPRRRDWRLWHTGCDRRRRGRTACSG
jgi:hypothetical protein